MPRNNGQLIPFFTNSKGFIFSSKSLFKMFAICICCFNALEEANKLWRYQRNWNWRVFCSLQQLLRRCGGGGRISEMCFVCFILRTKMPTNKLFVLKTKNARVQCKDCRQIKFGHKCKRQISILFYCPFRVCELEFERRTSRKGASSFNHLLIVFSIPNLPIFLPHPNVILLIRNQIK